MVTIAITYINMREKFIAKLRRGPIGLRLSIAVSRIVMAMWNKHLAQLSADIGLLIHLLTLYVDDVTAVVETLNLGVRWTIPSPRVANVSDVWDSPQMQLQSTLMIRREVQTGISTL